MQGFFGKPVDNLFAEPFIARWIRMNVAGWKDGVVVSKNAGGTKRVTSLADALKLNFGIVTTDRRRPKVPMTMSDSTVFFDAMEEDSRVPKDQQLFAAHMQRSNATPPILEEPEAPGPEDTESLLRPETPPAARRPSELEAAYEYTDVRVRDVVTGRLVQGQLVDDDYHADSGSQSGGTTPGAGSGGGDDNVENTEVIPDSMMNSMVSNVSSLPPDHALGGSFDAVESDDDEVSVAGPEHEKTITLVGEVRDRPVFIVDDMIDKSGSWIAAAETVVKRGGARKVYCIATHALFGAESLDQLEECPSIDHIVVTNTFPIPPSMLRSKKLIVIDVSSLLAESIRRHHYGER